MNHKDYSVLGYMDLIKRYDQADIYPFEKVKPLVAEDAKKQLKELGFWDFYNYKDMCPVFHRL